MRANISSFLILDVNNETGTDCVIFREINTNWQFCFILGSYQEFAAMAFHFRSHKLCLLAICTSTKHVEVRRNQPRNCNILQKWHNADTFRCLLWKYEECYSVFSSFSILGIRLFKKLGLSELRMWFGTGEHQCYIPLHLMVQSIDIFY